MKTRSIRRHNDEKFKRRCQKQIRNQLNFCSDDLANDPKFVGKLARTRKPCSCFMCGNPRRYFGEKTLRERRREQID